MKHQIKQRKKQMEHSGTIAQAWNEGYDSRSIISPYDAEQQPDEWLAWHEGYEYRSNKLNGITE